MISRARKQTTEADLTPMLDIVFILLVFFVVTMTFLKESAMDMTPPSSNSSDPLPHGPSAIVRIDDNGLIRVNGVLTDIGGVEARLQRLLAETPDLSVLVQAHPQAKNKFVILAVDQARSAGIQGVGFAVDAG
ncbi:MAG: biopolymer transporter ExbD [Ponticaulis sp.]|nr:biopolymer transporter ExbD [Ponticaulis sp.]